VQRPGGRPPWNNRPGGWAGGVNRPIHNRPSWANINNTVINNINNNWIGSINRPGNWTRPGSDRWGTWGNHVRDQWRWGHWGSNWFYGNWWSSHWYSWPGWHYGWAFPNYGWNYWWTVPTWNALSTWFTWSTSAVVQQPIFYDYGPGGNVTFQDNSVYIGGQQVASASDFAQSAAVLATVAPPESEDQAAAAEWMALGTFAVSTNEKDVEPTRILQLAVDRQGVVSGTMYNKASDETLPVQGAVEKDTQRVAFRIGSNQDVVAETGLYNLTQDEVPLLVHYGPDRTENFLLVRLEAPEEDPAATSGTQPGGAGDPFGRP
jgi:hypothetical protein